MSDSQLDDLRCYSEACEAYRLEQPTEALALRLIALGNRIANERLARDCFDLAYLAREATAAMKTLHSTEVETTTLEVNLDA